jgi:hypothetical protein
MRMRTPRVAPRLATLCAAALAAACTDATSPTPRLDSTNASAARAPAPNPARVHVVYLVPADREVDPVAERNMARAVEHLRGWYGQQLGGESFTLADDAVEVVRTGHPAAWYATTPNGDAAITFWNNATQEAAALVGASYADPDDVWLLYLDAEPACGQVTGAVASLALLPANDVRGIAGRPTINVCSGATEPDQGVCRWVGGLGHELGHALGLPHPPSCEDGDPATPCDTWALMYFGYTTYPAPEEGLTDDDEAHLAASPFFGPVKLPRRLSDCASWGAKRPLASARTGTAAIGAFATTAPVRAGTTLLAWPAGGEHAGALACVAT